MNPPPITGPERHRSSRLGWQLVALGLVIVGCKLWLIASYSSPLPFLDQWRGEGAELLRPWMKGELRASDLLAPFNEHRILPGRIFVLALFEANARQWDAQVQMVAAAFLHAACALVLGSLLVRQLGPRRQGPILAALAMLFCLPFDWQNTLWGFQCQFYFLILFTLLAFWGLAGHAAGSIRWWCGVGAGILACLSLGSGGLAGLALAGWLGIKFCFDPAARRQRGAWITLAVSLALGGLGFALYTPPEVASLQALQVRSTTAFLHNLGIHLSWPNGGAPLLALLAYAPLVVLGGLHLRAARRDPAGPAVAAVHDFLFPLGLWVVLQAAALAYSRNGPTAAVVSRYMDLLCLGALVNFCCLLRLLDLAAGARSARRAMLAGATVWTLVALAGLVPLLQRNLRLDLPSLQKIHRMQTAGVRQFLVTGRIEDLGGKPVFGLPPDELAVLAELLRDPAIQNILPTGLGIRRVPAAPGPLSAASQVLADGWGLVAGAGGFIFLLTGWSAWQAKRRRLSPTTPLRTDTAPSTSPA